MGPNCFIDSPNQDWEAVACKQGQYKTTENVVKLLKIALSTMLHVWNGGQNHETGWWDACIHESSIVMTTISLDEEKKSQMAAEDIMGRLKEAISQVFDSNAPET